MSSGTWSKRALLGGASALLLLGTFLNFRAMHSGGVDFPSLYVMGRGVLTGEYVYAPAVAATFPERFGVDVPMGCFIRRRPGLRCFRSPFCRTRRASCCGF